MASITKEIKKNSSVRFRVDIRIDGKRLTKRFLRLTDAKQWASTNELKLRIGEQINTPTKRTLAQAIDRYISEVMPLKRKGTQKFQIPQLNWFKARIGDVRLSNISASHLSTVRSALMTETIIRGNQKEPITRNPATVNRYFQVLAHVLSTARDEWEWIKDVPRIRKLRESAGRTEFFTPEESKAILDWLKVNKHDDVYLIALISNTVGSRLEETCALEWKDIDFLSGTIRFRQTKTGQDRIVPAGDLVINSLTSWRVRDGRHNVDLIFPAEQKTAKRPYVYDKIRKVFKRACIALGMKNRCFHHLRHTAASWMAQQGISGDIIGQTLGHQNRTTTKRYTHLTVHSMRGAVGINERELM